MLPNVTND